jgi:hypothetical protein
MEYRVESSEKNLRDSFAMALLETAGVQEGASSTDVPSQDDVWAIKDKVGAIKIQIPLSGMSCFSDSKCFFATNYVENLIVDCELHPVTNWVRNMHSHNGTTDIAFTPSLLNMTLEQEFIQLQSDVMRKFLSIQFPINKSLVVLLEDDENLLTVPDTETAQVVSRSFGKQQIASSSLITNLIIAVKRVDANDSVEHQYAQISKIVVSASGNTLISIDGRTANLMLNSHRAMTSNNGSAGYSYKLGQSSRIVQIPFKSILNSQTQFSSGVSLRNLSDFSVEVSYFVGSHHGTGKTHILYCNCSKLCTLSQSSATGKISTSLNI